MNLTYEQKKKIADDYLYEECGLDWDSLSDINSLHDAETEEEIYALCDDRMSEDLISFD